MLTRNVNSNTGRTIDLTVQTREDEPDPILIQEQPEDGELPPVEREEGEDVE